MLSDEATAAIYDDPKCDITDCDRLADWAYIGESGDLYLCEFHGGSGDAEQWTRIEHSDPTEAERLAAWLENHARLDSVYGPKVHGAAAHLRSQREQIETLLTRCFELEVRERMAQALLDDARDRAGVRDLQFWGRWIERYDAYWARVRGT